MGCDIKTIYTNAMYINAMYSMMQMLDIQLPFSEVELVNENAVYLARTLELQEVTAHTTAEAAGSAVHDKAVAALPGEPAVEFS